MRAAAVLFVALLAACTAKSPAVTMRFVDDVDGSPVSDARVLFCATAWGGTATGHGGPSAVLFRIEGQTDTNGVVNLPPREFEPKPFGLNTNYGSSSLRVAKPGYETKTILNTGVAPDELAAATTWAFNGTTVRLRRPPPGQAVAPGHNAGPC